MFYLTILLLSWACLGLLMLPIMVTGASIWIAKFRIHWSIGLGISFGLAALWTFVDAHDFFYVQFTAATISYFTALTARLAKPISHLKTDDTTHWRFRVSDLMVALLFISLTLGIVLQSPTMTINELGWLSLVGIGYGVFFTAIGYVIRGTHSIWRHMAVACPLLVISGYSIVVLGWPNVSPHNSFQFADTAELLQSYLWGVGFWACVSAWGVFICSHKINRETIHKFKSRRLFIFGPTIIIFAIGIATVWWSLAAAKPTTSVVQRIARSSLTGSNDFLLANGQLADDPIFTEEYPDFCGTTLSAAINRNASVYNTVALLEGYALEYQNQLDTQVILPYLHNAALKKLTERLIMIDDQAIPTNQIVENERAFSWNAQTTCGRLFIAMGDALLEDFWNEEYLVQLAMKSRTRRQLLIVAACLEQYQRRHKHHPDQLTDLSAILGDKIHYLNDPFGSDSNDSQSKKMLLYKRGNSDYTLYSRGINRTDDSGDHLLDPTQEMDDLNLKAHAESIVKAKSPSPPN